MLCLKYSLVEAAVMDY